MSLSAVLVEGVQAAVYALLALLVRLKAAWGALGSLAAGMAARLVAAVPVLHSALATLFTLPTVDHVGSRPRPPTVLGVAVADELADADWPAAVEALGCLLEWAHGCGFRTVLIYEPAGCLQQPHRLRQLELHLLLQRLNGAVRLQAGWRQQQPGGSGGGEGELTAVLLAAADGQWPLLAAAAAPVAASAAPSQQQQQHAAKDQPSSSAAAAVAGADAAESERAAAIDAAISAPAQLRRRLQAAGGALAGAEPDFVLVTGPALTLAGFPAWAVRTSEIYGVGPLAALTPGRLQGALRRFGATKQRFGK